MSQEFFANMARKWNHFSGIEQNYIDFSDTIHKMIPIDKNMRILDFGCGTGLLGQRFLDEVKTVAFLDTCGPMIEVTREELEKIGAKNVEIYNDEIGNINAEPFDVILALLVLHHVDDVEKTLSDLLRNLKPGGKIIALEFKREKGEHVDHKHGINHIHTMNLEDLFAKAGFVNVSVAPHKAIVKKKEDGTDDVKPTLTIYAEKPLN